jgi:hypothetical protein
VQSRGQFNLKSRAFELYTLDHWKKGEQVFICYGSHSNAKLLTEYGFVIPNNPNNCIMFKFAENQENENSNEQNSYQYTIPLPTEHDHELSIATKQFLQQNGLDSG